MRRCRSSVLIGGAPWSVVILPCAVSSSSISRHCPGQYVNLLIVDEPTLDHAPTPSSGSSRCAPGAPTSWRSRRSARSTGSGPGRNGSSTRSRSASSPPGSPRSDGEMTGARPRTVYARHPEGPDRRCRRWLAEPPAPPTLEFEGMVKVFFADGGTLEQLRANLTCIAETAEGRLAELEAKIDELEEAGSPFPSSGSTSTPSGCGSTSTTSASIRDWARWALDQIDEWNSTTDPGGWDHRAAYDLAEE